MRMIIEDRDGMSREFYADMQERADQFAGGRMILGGGVDGHVTILAIEAPDGGYGWIKGTGREAAAAGLPAHGGPVRQGGQVMAGNPLDEARPLLGKRVVVTLKLAEGETPAVVTEGTLLGFGTDGEFEVLHSDGTVHYCWPLLGIKKAGHEQ